MARKRFKRQGEGSLTTAKRSRVNNHSADSVFTTILLEKLTEGDQMPFLMPENNRGDGDPILSILPGKSIQGDQAPFSTQENYLDFSSKSKQIPRSNHRKSNYNGERATEPRRIEERNTAQGPKAKTEEHETAQEPKAKTDQEPKDKTDQEPKAKTDQEPKAKTDQEPKAKTDQEPKAKTEETQTRQGGDNPIFLWCLLAVASMTTISYGMANRQHVCWLIASSIWAFAFASFAWLASQAKSKARGGERKSTMVSLLTFLIVFSVIASQRENLLTTFDQEDLGANIRGVYEQMERDNAKALAPPQEKIAPSKTGQGHAAQINNGHSQLLLLRAKPPSEQKQREVVKTHATSSPQMNKARKGKTRKDLLARLLLKRRRKGKHSRVKSEKRTSKEAYPLEKGNGGNQGRDPPGQGGSQGGDSPGQGGSQGGDNGKTVPMYVVFIASFAVCLIVKGVFIFLTWVPMLLNAGTFMLTLTGHAFAWIGYIVAAGGSVVATIGYFAYGHVYMPAKNKWVEYSAKVAVHEHAKREYAAGKTKYVVELERLRRMKANSQKP